MRIVRRVVKVRRQNILIVLAALLPVTAAAQDAPRGYVQGTIGVARAVESDSNYAGLGAWRLSDRVHIFGEVGRMRNAIGPDLDAVLAAIGEDIRTSNQAQFGTTFPVEFDVRVPMWYGLGGVRVAGPSGGRVSTFLEGGVGTARLDPQAHLTINGESLDSEAAAITGLTGERQQLEFLTGVGGGVGLDIWKHLRVEGAYRYMRLFGDAKTNINRFGVSAGVTF